MYQPEHGKPPSAAATGFPVSVNNTMPAAYPGATAPVSVNNTTPVAYPGATYPGATAPMSVNNTTPAAYPGATASVYAPPPPLVEWSTGLCDCCSNPGNCCLTLCCPCVTFGKVAEIVDKGSTSCGLSGSLYALVCCVFGCGYLYSCCYRSKMREQYGLKGNGCTDCMTHCCCETCALCQEYRELENRGFNMDIGWHGNVEQRTRGIAMSTTAPAAQSGMNR